MNILTQARSGGGGEASEEMAERVERLEQRVSEVRAQSSAGGDGVTPRQVAEAPAVKTIEKRLGALEKDVSDLESYVYDWTEAAETYIKAFRRFIKEKFDTSLNSYLQAVEAEEQE